jgi:hypothetical protein
VDSLLSVSLVTTASRVFGIRMEETVSTCGGYMRMYGLCSYGQPTKGGPPTCGLGGGLTTPHMWALVNMVRLQKGGELSDNLAS